MTSSFVRRLRERFPDREEWTEERAYEEYSNSFGVSHVDLKALFDLIEMELEIPAGFLRPYDDMNIIFEPTRSKNPLRWFADQTRAGDAEAELTDQLRKRLRKYGTEDSWRSTPTFGDLVKAWCGKLPEDGSE